MEDSNSVNIDYLCAKILALSTQYHFFSGHIHPFYEYASIELENFLHSIAKHDGRNSKNYPSQYEYGISRTKKI